MWAIQKSWPLMYLIYLLIGSLSGNLSFQKFGSRQLAALSCLNLFPKFLPLAAINAPGLDFTWFSFVFGAHLDRRLCSSGAAELQKVHSWWHSACPKQACIRAQWHETCSVTFLRPAVPLLGLPLPLFQRLHQDTRSTFFQRGLRDQVRKQREKCF